MDSKLFSLKNGSKRGYSSKCKDCHNQYVREKWYPANAEKQKRSASEWKKKNPAKVLSVRYNVDIEVVEDILEKSDGKCQICGQKKALHLDHCHSTGKVRGLLCLGCNTLLGRLGDTDEKIREKTAVLLAYIS